MHRLPAEDRVGFAIALFLFLAASVTGVLWATRSVEQSGLSCSSMSCRLLGGSL